MNIDFLRRAQCPTLELFLPGGVWTAAPLYGLRIRRIRRTAILPCATTILIWLWIWQPCAAIAPCGCVPGRWAAASLVLPEMPSVSHAVAINGTLWPINDELGIPVAVYDATLRVFQWKVWIGLTGACAARTGPCLRRAGLRAAWIRCGQSCSRCVCAADTGRAKFTDWNLAVLSSKERNTLSPICRAC